MKIKKSFSLFYLLLFILLCSCGYSMHRYSSLPFTEIKIGLIENRTLEPKLQDKLHKSLTEEFLNHGISINPAAGLKITGIIHSFDMMTLSEKKGVAVEYQVIIKADFRIIDEKGDIKDIKNISSPFIVPFTGSEDFGRLLANRDAAMERALSDVAMQIIGSLIYK